MNYKKYKIIFLDPTGHTGCLSEDELYDFEPEECVIEAYVYSKDKKFVITFASYTNNTDTDEMEFGDCNVIPTACIKSMRKI